MTTKILAAAAASSVAALAAATPGWAAAPAVTTGPASGITADRAIVRGAVDPNREATTYSFEYGTTRRMGLRTADTSAGRGSRAVRARAELTGLRPKTRYFYRLVASNATGVTNGRIRAFTTRVQPLGLALSVTPNPVRFDDPIAIAGQLTGTGNAGRQIVLQQRAFPYTGPFADVGSRVVTDASGAFTFNMIELPISSQLRAFVADRPATATPVAVVSVALRVRTDVSTSRPRRGRRVRFSGVVRPSRVGARYAIQRLTSTGNWMTVSGSVLRRGRDGSAIFSKRVRVRRSGRYRVFVESVGGGDFVSGIGRTIRLRAR